MKIIFRLISYIYFLPLFAQEVDVENYKNNVDYLFKSNSLTEKQYHPMSYCGGSLKGYYFDGELKLLITKNSGETETVETNWYVYKSKLLVAIQKSNEVVPPKDWEIFCKENIDEKGNCNLSVLKRRNLTTSINLAEKPILKMWEDKNLIVLSVEEKRKIIKEATECFSILKNEINQ